MAGELAMGKLTCLAVPFVAVAKDYSRVCT